MFFIYFSIDTDTAAKLSRTMREVEQLKMDHEIAMEKKEKQVLADSTRVN